jgi:hypothetical protein
MNPRNRSNQRFNLLFLEHQRWQVEPSMEHIANASFAFDRHAAGHQILNIAVNCAFRHFQRLAQVTRPGRRLAAEHLNDFE